MVCCVLLLVCCGRFLREVNIGHAREKEKDFLVNGQLSNWIDRSRVDRGQQPHKTTLEKLIHPKEA